MVSDMERSERALHRLSAPRPDSILLQRLRFRVSLERSDVWLDFPGGWNHIIDELDRALARIDPSYEITVVKEKFGELRWHCSIGASPEPMRLIDQACRASVLTCERCARPGRTRGTYWRKTLCDSCLAIAPPTRS